MEKGCFGMGIIYNFNGRYSKNQNTNIKKTFLPILACWITSSNNINTTLNSHLLGKRNGFYIINLNHHIEMLKRILNYSNQLSTANNSNILFINNSFNYRFDGLIKLFSLRCGESYFIGKWVAGYLTKNTTNLAYKTLIVYNPDKAKFLIKEVNKVGIPMIGLVNINADFFQIMYPLLSNTMNANSMFYISLILTNSIIEGKLINHIKTVE